MDDAPLVFTVNDVLRPEECIRLIAQAEMLAFAAPVNPLARPLTSPHAPPNKRVAFADHTLADRLLARVRRHLPPTLDALALSRCDERLRFYRAGEGERVPLDDDLDDPDERERSLLGLLVYLNQAFGGGSIEFPALGPVAPTTGLGVLYRHGAPHTAAPVDRGLAYVLRADILYRRRD